MRQLLINNATAVPAASGTVNDPTEVAEARVAAFNPEDYASGSLNLSLAYTGDTVEFVQGGKAGEEPLRTSLINVKDVVAVHEKTYVAPTAQVSTITPATGTGTATVRVVKVSNGYQPHERITIDVVLDGKTATQIVDDFVAQFNAQSPNFVTAANNTDELELTGDLGISFETSLDNEAADWAIAAVAPNFGTGTSEMLKNMEEFAYGGNFTNRIYLPVNPPSYVVDGETYDLFTIQVKTNTTPNISKANEFQEITIAVQATATGIDLPTFFGV